MTAAIALGAVLIAIAIAGAGRMVADALTDLAAAVRGTWPRRDQVAEELERRSAP